MKEEMIPRALGEKIASLAGMFPIVSLTGPRQSGKTTLARATFPDYAYVNLENLDDRLAAEEDPLLGDPRARFGSTFNRFNTGRIIVAGRVNLLRYRIAHQFRDNLIFQNFFQLNCILIPRIEPGFVCGWFEDDRHAVMNATD